MTAMHASDLPPALVRSGRVELWLETRHPDDVARRTLIERKLGELPQALRAADATRIAGTTAGFSGADIITVMRDAVALMAWDEAHGLPAAAAEHYFTRAARDVEARRRASGLPLPGNRPDPGNGAGDPRTP
jgi:ATP-dependent 26S proteasome regulatory subunit